MADFDWKSIVKSVAPTIATALGGPLAGLAVKTIGDALGVDAPTQENITARLSGATSDDLLKLKQAEQDFAAKMKQMDIDVFALELKDRESARLRDTAIETSGKFNWSRISLTAFAMITLILLMFFVMKDATISEYAQGIITLIIGRLTGYLDGIFNFEFGSTRSSQTKDDTIKALGKNSGA